MTNWVEYAGSDEQIAEMMNSKSGFLISELSGINESTDFADEDHLLSYLKHYKVTHYWTIPEDPLREMKIRWAQTGQPVWVRYPTYSHVGVRLKKIALVTTTPDWNIPNAEYSFSPFED